MQPMQHGHVVVFPRDISIVQKLYVHSAGVTNPERKTVTGKSRLKLGQRRNLIHLGSVKNIKTQLFVLATNADIFRSPKIQIRPHLSRNCETALDYAIVDDISFWCKLLILQHVLLIKKTACVLSNME
jgi:hypothetical protein